MAATFAFVAVIVLAGGLCSAAPGAKTGLEQLRKDFAQPAVTYRALPMEFDQAKPADYAAKLVDGDWGGAMFRHDGTGGYLTGKEGWDRFRAAVAECKRSGLECWIYDEQFYPSGRAGGQTLDDHPEYEARGLFYASKDLSLKSTEQVEWKLPDGDPFYVAACRLSWTGTIYGEAVDLTAKVREGVLRAGLEGGDWRIVAFVENRLYDGTHAPITTGQPYLNIMDPAAVKRFIELTHERYYSNCGAEFGKTIRAVFTDEPSVQGGYLVAKEQPCPALSWYSGLPDIFEKRNGYDIRKALPALFNDAGGDTVRYRCDFYSTIAQQIADAYFRPIREWCSAHGVASTGHLLWEESLIYHAAFYGSVFPSLRELDWPGIDVLGCGRQATSGSHIEGGPIAPKLISSAAHVYGKHRTMSESFCFVKGDTRIEESIAHVAWQWTLGINSLIVMYPADQYSKAACLKLNDFTGRVGAVLTKGDFVADVAVLYPIASVWADFIPTNRHVSYVGDQPKCKDVDEAFRSVSRELLACQRDYDYLDEDALCGARISNGTIKIGRNSYRVLVLPHVKVLRYQTLKQIAEFVDSGGRVITYKTVPSAREDAGPQTDFTDLVDRVCDKAKHIETLRSLDAALKDCGTPDLSASPRAPEINYQHRALIDGDAYFILNNGANPFTGKFAFRATGKAQVWDPMTGRMKPAAASATKGVTTIQLTVPPLTGLFVMLSR